MKKGNKVVAALPYNLKHNRFFKWIGMPRLSKLHGPQISQEYDNNRHRHSIVDELLDQLPEIAFYQQSLSYNFKNWLPYLWKGYSQVTLYSYIFSTLDLPVILAGMETDCRRRIRKAEQRLHCSTGLSFQTFYNVLSKTYARQTLPFPFDFNFLQAYYAELKSRSLAEIFFIVDNSNVVHAVAMLIWDESSSYYLLEGTDPDAPDKNAAVYLKWMAIKYTKENLKLDKFDFEGSISRRIEKIYREFGAQATPYFVIKKYNSNLFFGLKFIQNYRQYGKLVQW